MRKLLMLAVLCAGCGRYASPIPPELLAPKHVEELTAQADAAGVTLSWTAPDQDRRGKELRSSEGYKVMRREQEKAVSAAEEEREFVEIGFLPDQHVEIRDKLRKEAREAGKVGRRIKAPSEAVQFTYTDKGLTSGKSYLYRIVPVNQGGEEGEVRQVVRVNFSGIQSAVSVEDADDYDAIEDESAPEE